MRRNISLVVFAVLLGVGSISFSRPSLGLSTSATLNEKVGTKLVLPNSDSLPSGSAFVRMKVEIPRNATPIIVRSGNGPSPNDQFSYARWPFIEVRTDLGFSPPRLLTSFGVTSEVFGGRPLNLVYPFDADRNTLVEVSVFRGRLISISVNGQVRFEYRFDRNLLPGTPSLLELVGGSNVHPGLSASVQIFRLRTTPIRHALSSVLLLLGYLVLFGLLLRDIRSTFRNASTSPSIKVFLTMTICFSVIGWFVGWIGANLFPRRIFQYYDGSGWTVSWLVRFSDFYELVSIARSPSPYEFRNSNYPPLILALLRNVPLETEPRYIYFAAFLVVVSTGLLFKHRAQLVALVLIITYPFWFAFDRGSSDLLMVLLFAAFLLLFEKQRYLPAAVVLGVMISLKVIPVVLIALFIQRRLWRLIPLTFLLAALYTILGSLILPEHGLSEIPRFVRVLLDQSEIAARNINLAPRNLSLSAQMIHLESVFNLDKDHVLLVGIKMIVLLFVLCSVLMCVTIGRNAARSFLILNVSSFVLLDISFEYRLLYLIPAILLMVFEEDPSATNIRLVPLFALLFSFHPIWINQALGFSAGTTLSFLLLLVILVFLDVAEIRAWRERSRIISRC